MPKARTAAAAHPLVGSWNPAEEDASNLIITVAEARGRLQVAVRDAFDGERMKVSGVSWDGKVLRFATVTPSTGARLQHELERKGKTGATYRCIVTQVWERAPDSDQG